MNSFVRDRRQFPCANYTRDLTTRQVDHLCPWWVILSSFQKTKNGRLPDSDVHNCICNLICKIATQSTPA